MNSIPKKNKVMTVRDVEHKSRSQLIGIRGHQYYFVNLVSGIIYYKDSKYKFSTHETEIRKAIAYVEQEKLRRGTGVSQEHAQRVKRGEVNPLLSSIWQELYDSRKQSKSHATLERYRTVWKHSLEPFWSKKSISEVTPQNIDSFSSWYLKHRGDKIFDRTFVYLKMLFAFAQERGYLKTIPKNIDRLSDLKDTIKQRTHYQKAGRVATKVECIRLIESATMLENRGGIDSKNGTKIKLAITLALTMGLRKMEACSLRWDKVDFEAGFIEVWSKNKHWRRVPMSQKARECLLKQKELTGHTAYVFASSNDDNRYIASQVMDHYWNQVKDMAGIEKRLRFHDLRHTFATMTAEENWPPVIACKVLDMSLRVYQSVYCKPSDEKIAGYFKAQDTA